VRRQFCTAVAQSPFCALSTSYTEKGHCTDYAAVLLRPLTPHRASKKLGLEQAVLGTRNFNEVDLEESEARKVLLYICVSEDDAVCC
jgi:hypothetical protein